MTDAAQRHLGARWMIKADIHNYFPSIDERSVFKFFMRAGYAPLLAFELARLCTWPPTGAIAAEPVSEPKMPYTSRGSGVLPQGAPTSGALSNLVTRPLDDAIANWALSEELVYSRYSDDVILSTTKPFDRKLAAKHARDLSGLMRASGFEIHDKKTRVISPGARKVVLGMLLGENSLRILPEQRRMMDLYIHAVRRYSVTNYAKRRKFDSPISFINHVNGHLAHMKQIEPEWAASRTAAWVEVLEDSGIFPDAMR